MNASKPLFCLIYLFAGCQKEEQQMVFASAYTINEGGQIKDDYLFAFEGHYLMKCKTTSNLCPREITVRPMFSRSAHLAFDADMDAGMQNDRGQSIAVQVDSSGSFTLDKQQLKIRNTMGNSTDYAINSGSGNFIKGVDSLVFNYIYSVNGGFPEYCSCAGIKR